VRSGRILFYSYTADIRNVFHMLKMYFVLKQFFPALLCYGFEYGNVFTGSFLTYVKVLPNIVFLPEKVSFSFLLCLCSLGFLFRP